MTMLQKTLDTLSVMTEAQIMQVYEYAEQLKEQSAHEYITKQTITPATKKYRIAGGLTGKFYMADDFDETPDCFAEYM